jgi:carbamoylphosphate synthase large subunit
MKVFVIGSGPQAEGQVCALAVRALLELGHEVVLLEPSPSSPAEAQRTYLEPLTVEAAERIIAAERPDAILAGIGRAATALALQLRTSLTWLGPKPRHLMLPPPPPDADTVVEVVGKTAVGQIEQLGDTWVCPAPLHRPDLDAAAVKAIAKLGFHGCARVAFKGSEMVGLDTVVGAASAFSSPALGVSIPRQAVRLALGLPVDESPKPGAVAARRMVGGTEVMTLSRAGAPVAPGKSVLVLGAAGVEEAVRAEGLTPIVVDADPAALSDPTVARYFEAPELEAVLALCKKEQPHGVVVQLGGMKALELAPELEAHGVTVLGTKGADLRRAFDRSKLSSAIAGCGLQEPARGTAATIDEALKLAARLSYPVLVRSGPREPQLTYARDAESLKAVFSGGAELQAFVSEATQACVELLRDREGRVLIGGVVEHVEQAGIHAADAACTLPPHSLKPEVIEKLKDAATALARELNIVGLLDVHFALQGKAVWVLEVNPRASRTLPFVAKATGLKLAKLATRLMLGRTLQELGVTEDPVLAHCAVREAVFNENVALGPTRRSVGAVMAVADSLSIAFGKTQLAAGTALPRAGTAFISVQEEDRPAVVDLARRLAALGFGLACTGGTREYLEKKGIASRLVRDGTVHESISSRLVSLVICTVAFSDFQEGGEIRAAARAASVPNFTTVEAARLAVGALEAQAAGARPVVPLQAYVQ